LGIYFWVHKAMTPPLVRALGGALLDSASAVVLVSLGGGMGRKCFAWLIPAWSEAFSRPERLAGEALAGLGLVSLLMFGVGLVSLSMVAMGLLIVLCGTLAWREWAAWGIDLFAWVRQYDFPDRWSVGLAGFILLSLWMAWMMAVTPPSTFDALTYQLLGPQLAVEAGRFQAFEGNHFFAFPQTLNTLFAGQMALLNGRLTGAAILHGLVGVLWLMAIGGYGTRRFSPFVGRLAPAILLSASSIWLQFTWAYVDLWTGACGMMTWIALEEWRTAVDGRMRQRWAIVAGIFVGLAMSAKYNALLLGLLVGLYLIVVGWRDRITWGDLGRDVLLYGVTASVVLLPWLARNAVFYGNPIYPFGPATSEWDSLLNDWYNAADRAPLREYPALTLPILISPTFLGVEGGAIWSATIGPLFLLLIPLLAMVWGYFEADWRRSLLALLGLVTAYHGVWLLMTAVSVYGGQTRFVFPMFGWLAILAAAALQGFQAYPTQPLNLAWMLRTLVALALGLTLLNHVANMRPREGDQGLQGTTTNSHFAQSRALEYWMGMLDEQAYLDEQLGWTNTAMQQVNALPSGAQVQFLWETRSLYCDERRITCHEDEILAGWWHDRRSIGDGSAEAILQAWQGRGITHVLLWEDGRQFEFEENPRLTAQDQAELERLRGLLTLAWEGGDSYYLYALPTLTPD
jgi:hypothetical protein